MFRRAARITAIGLIAALVSLLGFSAPAHASGPGYYYADGQQVLTGGSYTKGLSANVWIAQPYVQCANPGEHSIMELALADANGNTVEMGWFRDCANSTTMNDTRLFITYWNNGTWCGAYTGGAGTSCPQYVDNSSNSMNSGSSLASIAGATFPGNVKSMSFQYATGSCGAASAGWFFYFDGSNVGCIPPTAFPGGFTTGSRMLAYGEVAYSGGGALPCTDMGTGSSTGSVGASGDAYFSNISYVGPTNPVGLTPNFTLSQTNAAAYATHSLGVTGNKSFTFGGAGGTGSPRTTPGIVNGC